MNETPLGTVIAAPKPEDRELFCRNGSKWFAKIPKTKVLAALNEIQKQRLLLNRAKLSSDAGIMLAVELDLAARMAEQSCKFMLWQQAVPAAASPPPHPCPPPLRICSCCHMREVLPCSTILRTAPLLHGASLCLDSSACPTSFTPLGGYSLYLSSLPSISLSLMYTLPLYPSLILPYYLPLCSPSLLSLPLFSFSLALSLSLPLSLLAFGLASEKESRDHNVHTMCSFLSWFFITYGMYVIYNNKEISKREHYTSVHQPTHPLSHTHSLTLSLFH